MTPAEALEERRRFGEALHQMRGGVMMSRAETIIIATRALVGTEWDDNPRTRRVIETKKADA